MRSVSSQRAKDVFCFSRKDTHTHATPSSLYESVDSERRCDLGSAPPKNEVELELMTVDEIVNGQRGGGFQVRLR